MLYGGGEGETRLRDKAKGPRVMLGLVTNKIQMTLFNIRNKQVNSSGANKSARAKSTHNIIKASLPIG